MKNLCVAIVWCLVTTAMYGQKPEYFEGSLSYKIFCKSDQIPEDSLNRMMAGVSVYFYKSAFYKGLVFSRDTLVYLYNGKSGKCLFTQTSNTGVYCMNYTDALDDAIGKRKLFRAEKSINGYPCRMVETRYPDHVSRSYYHTSIRHAPDLYSQHAAYGYRDEMKLARGGILVMSERIYPTFTVVTELVNIFPEELEDATFAPEIFENCK